MAFPTTCIKLSMLVVAAVMLPTSIGERQNGVIGEPDDLDAFLASLDMDTDPVQVVNNAGLQTSGTQSNNPMIQNKEAIEEVVEIRDRQDQMHVSEAHKMKCSEMLRNSNMIGEQRRRTFEQSALMIPEDQTIYQDPNDDTSSGGHNRNAHPQHLHNCHAVRDHSVRKVAMVGELDMPPFFEKLGEFDIAGLDHSKFTDDNTLFTKVVWRDSQSKALGLDTVKPDGNPTIGGGMPLKQWVITSKTWDKEVKPKLDEIAKELAVAKKFGAQGGQQHVDGLNCDNAFSNLKEVDFKIELGCLLEAIEKQEKFIPFNHKLERIDLDFYKCRKGGMLKNKIQCDPQGTLYVHDGKLIHDSAELTRMNSLVASTSKNARSTSSYLAEPGLKVGGGAQTVNGMEVEGQIAWSVTVSKTGNCAPAMQPLLYIGIGTDSETDLDLGAVLYSWEAGGRGTQMSRKQVIYYGKTGQQPGQISESFTVRKCEMQGSKSSGHTATTDRLNNCGVESDAMVEYSGDNMDGSGEGDDEWMAFDLEKLQRAHVTHIAVVVNIYGTGQTFDTLEGAFFRAVMSDRGEKSWASAQTVEYVDIDEMKSAHGKRAAILATFFVDDLKNLLLPDESKKMAISHEYATSPEIRELKSKLMELKSKFTELNSMQQADFNRMKADLVRISKSKFETVVSKHPMDCGSRSCSLPNVYGDIENYFTQNVGPTKPFGGGSNTATAKEKAKEVDAVTLHDLDGTSNTEVGSEIDDFLASLDTDIPSNENLGLEGNNPTQIDLAAHSMSDDEFNKGLLIEFAGGPPGSDVLCIKK